MEKLLGRKSNLVQDQLEYITTVDRNDPMYDNQSEPESYYESYISYSQARRMVHNRATYSVGRSQAVPETTFAEYVKLSENILTEFYRTLNSSKVVDTLKESQCKLFHSHFVKEALRTSLDKNVEDQQRVSSLLTVLVLRKVLSRQHITRGFEKLVQSIDDLSLDVPFASDQLSKFIKCAIDDGILDAKFVLRLPESFLASCPTNAEIEGQLTRLRECKENLRAIIPDFFNDGSIEFVNQMLGEKTVSNFLGHELIRLLVISSMQRTDREREFLSCMLDQLYGSKISADDVQFGFSRLIGDIDELKLDIVDADHLLAKFMVRALCDDILPPSFVYDTYRLHFGGKLGILLLEKVGKWYSRFNGKLSRFQKVWVGCDPTRRQYNEFVQQLKTTLNNLLTKNSKIEDTLMEISSLELAPDQASLLVQKIAEHLASLKSEEQLEDAISLSYELFVKLCDNDELDSDTASRGFSAAEVVIENQLKKEHKEKYAKFVDACVDLLKRRGP